MVFLLLLLLVPVAEIYVLIQVGARIGFVNTIFALLVFGVLGAGLAKAQGRYLLRSLRESLNRGELPTFRVLQGVLVFVGGVLFLIPGFLTDLIGAFFVLPGPRHLIAAMIQRKLARQISSGRFKVYASGPSDRDVTPKVIDITPISSRTRRKSESDSSGSSGDSSGPEKK